jgi:5-formyltetrahydrofolate cyclo-ligase
VDIRTAKRDLRARMRAIRDALSSEAVDAMSAAIAAHVMNEPSWTSARAVAGFVGVRGEPDTRELLEHALAMGKALWLPRVLGPTELGFVRVRSLDTLVPGGFGLLEPPPSERTHALTDRDVDLVLVPGLAFASNGARLGFGRGYYDRALASFAAIDPPLRLGLCFAAMLDAAEIPTDENDVPMHAIATEHGIVRVTAQ